MLSSFSSLDKLDLSERYELVSLLNFYSCACQVVRQNSTDSGSWDSDPDSSDHSVGSIDE